MCLQFVSAKLKIELSLAIVTLRHEPQEYVESEQLPFSSTWMAQQNHRVKRHPSGRLDGSQFSRIQMSGSKKQKRTF